MQICLLNHTPTPELGECWVPSNIKLWGTIPQNDVWGHLAPLFREILEHAVPGDTCVLAGEPRACFLMVSALEARGIKCFDPYSERVSVDEPQPDGSVRKASVFRFLGLSPSGLQIILQ